MVKKLFWIRGTPT